MKNLNKYRLKSNNLDSNSLEFPISWTPNTLDCLLLWTVQINICY